MQPIIPPPEPPNQIHDLEPQLKLKYPTLTGSTAWKVDENSPWQYQFSGIVPEQQAEVLAYARTLGEVP